MGRKWHSPCGPRSGAVGMWAFDKSCFGWSHRGPSLQNEIKWRLRVRRKQRGTCSVVRTSHAENLWGTGSPSKAHVAVLRSAEPDGRCLRHGSQGTSEVTSFLRVLQVWSEMPLTHFQDDFLFFSSFVLFGGCLSSRHTRPPRCPPRGRSTVLMGQMLTADTFSPVWLKRSTLGAR